MQEMVTKYAYQTTLKFISMVLLVAVFSVSPFHLHTLSAYAPTVTEIIENERNTSENEVFLYYAFSIKHPLKTDNFSKAIIFRNISIFNDLLIEIPTPPPESV